MKIEKGDRKLAVTRQSAFLLLAGLLVTLTAAGYFKLDTATCVQAFVVYAGALFGKDSAFMWGNAKEHAAAAATPKPDPKAP